MGGFLMVAPRPLFAVHAGTTWLWGLALLEDQQLGGLIMWVPGSDDLEKVRPSTHKLCKAVRPVMRSSRLHIRR
ncbi:cytochrome c oxidase assembly protein [Microvirga sp. TS319]|uniref:cytochrome c oxidase assembly protein n=1 Tax=Microvirga sp. TS319 TaxID=3241165 RepID=UPI00351AA0DD